MLRRGGQASTGLEIPSIDTGIETGFGRVRLALGSAGELRLLLPVRQSERIADIPANQSLHIGVSTYLLNGTPIRYLDIVCLNAALDGAFADVCAEIIRRISDGAAPTEASLTTLDDFRSLLIVPSAEVTSQEMRGLIAELVMLRRLLNLDPRAWRLWRGPLMERHDFRGGSFAIEVKSSARVAGRSVTISSIDQLVAPVEGALHLYLLQLEEAAGTDLSISRLAAESISMASDPQQIRDLLAALGCADPDARAWNRASFRIEGEHQYAVDAAFPRIVPESFIAEAVPEGVVSLSYTIDLAAAEGSRLDALAAETHVREMIACLDHP
nr:PD-(D/E)XK motif protein [Bosea vaviloviae]